MRFLKNPKSELLLHSFPTMASRCRSLSTPAISLIKSTITKPSIKPRPAAFSTACSPPTISRLVPRLGSLESLLPLHSAVSSARLTSCLGIDSMSSRSLSQGATLLEEIRGLQVCSFIDPWFEIHELGLSVPR